jgi:amino acid transporter
METSALKKPPAGASGSVPTSGDLFTRQASGLVRSINTRTLFGFAIGAMLATSVFTLASGGMITFPGSDFTIPLIVGGIVAVLVILPYMQLVAAIPRSGGDYVFASRIFGPLVGAFAGSCVMGSFLLLNAFNCSQLVTSWLEISLQILGLVFAKGTFDRWAAQIPAHQSTEFICCVVFLLVVLGICLLPTKTVLKVIFVSFALCTLGGFLLLVQFVIHSNADFQHAFDNFANTPHGAYATILHEAAKRNIQTTVKTSAVLQAVPLGVFAFTGLTFTVYSAGEIKGATKTFRNGTLAAVAFISLYVIVLWIGLKHFSTYHFLAASSGLNSADPTTYAKLTNAPTLSGGILYGALTADPVSQILIAVSNIAGLLAAVLTVFMATSRIIFAFSFDKLLPKQLADVNERTSSPVKALVVVFVISLGLAAASVFSTLLVTIASNVLLLFLVYWGISSAAAAILPYRRPELFAASPKVLPGKVAGVPIVTLCGTFTFLVVAALFVIVVTNKNLAGSFSTTSIIELAIIALFGPIAYFVSRWRLRVTQGIDLDLALRELPPE